MDRKNWIFQARNSTPLFHYCSSDTFQAICQSRTIRFSSLLNSNDSQEIKLGKDLVFAGIERAKQRLSQESEDLNKLYWEFAELYEFGHMLGACFSLNGDLLSQWRGYGDDGLGFSIGFNPILLRNIFSFYTRVLYEKPDQNDFIDWSINQYLEYDPDKATLDSLIFKQSIFRTLVQMKNASFKEEEEVRLVIQLAKINNKLVFQKTHEHVKGVQYPEINFNIRSGKPIPYVDVRYGDSIKHGISQVILGPKNPSAIEEIEVYLNTIGLEGVKVIRSKSSYR